MEKMKQECKVKKPLKIWQGVLTLLVSAVILFVAAPILLSPFGMYGSLLGELLLFGVAVGAVLLFQGDLREVFPLNNACYPEIDFIGMSYFNMFAWMEPEYYYSTGHSSRLI